MNAKNLFLIAGLAIGLAACQDRRADNDESSADTSRISNSSSNPDYNNDVPQATRTSFETKYPQASNVRWVKYDPSVYKTTLEPSDVRYNLDANDYEVRFNFDNTDYVAWYDDGAWIYSTTRVGDHSALPIAVNNRIKNDFPDYKIVEVDKENDKDRLMYEVELEKGSDKLKLLIAENGEVIKKKDNKGNKEKKDVK
jgi:hypothetical protein